MMKARLKRLEKAFEEYVDNRPLSREILEWLVQMAVEVVIEEACLKALGVPGPKYQEFVQMPMWSRIRNNPRVEAEIRRRLPVLRAWRAWHRAQRAPYVGELNLQEWANWDWAVSAVYCLRRDGTRGVPEAETLLKVADEGGVGTPEEEKQRSRKLALMV